MMRFKLKPPLFLFLIDLCGFGSFILMTDDLALQKDAAFSALIFFGAVMLIYFLMAAFKLGDVYLYLIAAFLVSIGLIMLFRIDFASYGRKQTAWFFIGIGLFLISYIFMRFIKVWDRLLVFYAAMTFVLFFITLIFGSSIKGAKNWIKIGSLTIQPSEIIKIFYVFTLACFISKKTPDNHFFNTVRFGFKTGDLLLSAYVYGCVGFFAILNEWGTALLFFLTYFVAMFIYDKSLKLVLVNGIMSAFIGILGYFFTDQISTRVHIWLNPWTDMQGKGYQIAQSLFAIVSGGFFGSGLGQGSPTSIPESHSDFIFSAICEEMGLFTGIAVIMCYFIFTYRGVKIALKTNNDFYKAVAILLTTVFGFQTFIIIGGVIKMIPLTGITLPFVSYGGSSIISSFIMLGIMAAISSSEKNL